MRSIRTLRALGYCTHDNFGVSKTTGDGIDGAVLHVTRLFQTDNEALARRHLYLGRSGNGRIHFCITVVDRLFPTRDEADQWAFEHGYLQEHFSLPELRAERKARALDKREIGAFWDALSPREKRRAVREVNCGFARALREENAR